MPNREGNRRLRPCFPLDAYKHEWGYILFIQALGVQNGFICWMIIGNEQRCA